MYEDTPSGEWTNYNGYCGAESKHISFKISLMNPQHTAFLIACFFNALLSLLITTFFTLPYSTWAIELPYLSNHLVRIIWLCTSLLPDFSLTYIPKLLFNTHIYFSYLFHPPAFQGRVIKWVLRSKNWVRMADMVDFGCARFQICQCPLRSSSSPVCGRRFTGK